MKMHGSFLRALSVALFAVAAVFLIYYAEIILFSGTLGIQALLRSLFWCVIVIGMPLGFAMALYAGASGDAAKNRLMVQTTLIVLFGFYLLALAGTLFVSRIHPETFRADRAAYMARIEDMVNVVPLRTVRRYLDTLKRGVIPLISFANLVGNVLLFMPMGFFLPCLFPKMRSFWRFPLLMLAMLVAVELLQFFLCCGTCDVDDVLLNFTGTLITFLFVMLPPIQTLLTHLHLFRQPGTPTVSA